MWKKAGRRFDSIGYANAKGHVIINTEIFPNTKFGYNKRLFNVSTLPVSSTLFQNFALAQGMILNGRNI